MHVRPFVLALIALAAVPAGAAADSWTRTGSMATSRSSFPATLLPNGQVVVAGGITNSSAVGTRVNNASERYDPATGSWLASPSLPGERSDQAASLMADGRVLMTGGIDAGNDVLDGALVFDPATNAWSRTTAMPHAHGAHSQVTLPDGRVLVISGHNTRAEVLANTAYDQIELYDPTLKAWTIGRDMPYFMTGGTTTLLADGTVLVAGGSTGLDHRNASLRYFPAINRWRDAGTFTVGRSHQVAALLPNGKVLIAGGSSDGGAALRSAALYDPATNSWTDVAPMAGARTAATATLLPNGKVLVAGGFVPDSSGYGTYLATAELFDPATNTWSPAPSLATPRGGASATLLSDGRVLVAGGSRNIYNTTETAEIYTPDGWPFPRGGDGSGGGDGDGTGGPGTGGTPKISTLALSASRFRAAGSGPSVTAARKRRAPIGTTISYRDAAAATATLTVLQPTTGRHSGGRCARPTRANRRRAHCTRWTTVGRFTHTDSTGTNSLHFSGRVNGHKLPPGRYRLSISARIGRGTPSATDDIGFRVVS